MSHIFYVDDVLLVARATTKEGLCIKAILEAYCSIFGQFSGQVREQADTNAVAERDDKNDDNPREGKAKYSHARKDQYTRKALEKAKLLRSDGSVEQCHTFDHRRGYAHGPTIIGYW